MKWNKYVEFAGSNPTLRKFLDELVGSEQFNTRDFPTFQAWVEKQVVYLAVRPWTSLNMASRNSHTMKYVVFYHIQDNEAVGGRETSLTDSGNRSRSVGQTIREIVYRFNQTDRLPVFDAVVRIHYDGVTDGYRREAFEFFIAPDGFMPKF